MSKEHLATYLNDHLGGSGFAMELLDHLASEGSSSGLTVVVLRKDIDEDRDELKSLIARLGIAESRVRKAGGWIAEVLTEVKLEVDDDPNGPLRRLERVEALAVGIQGKIALWQALESAVTSNAELAGVDYARLIQRGQEQHARVEALRLEAARIALAI